MITINLLRISPDSKYLEFSVECPIDYKFTRLYIKKYDMTPIDDTDNLWRDCSHLYSTTTPTPTRQVMRISTEALSGLTIDTGASTMFYVQFGVSYALTASAYNVGTTYASGDTVTSGAITYKSKQAANVGKPLTDTAWWEVLPVEPEVLSACSDVNKIYPLLRDHLFNLNASCPAPSDVNLLIRNYLNLYGHTTAMFLERFDDAEIFYDILKSEFSNCTGTTSRDTYIRNNNSCNCS